MRVIPAILALGVGVLVTGGSMDMSRQSHLEECASAYHAMIDAPQAASGSFAQRFESVRKAYPGPCQLNADEQDALNAMIGGGIIAFITYIFLLLIGKLCRWAER